MALKSSLTSFKEIFAHMKEQEAKDLNKEVQRGMPIRLPNADYDTDDPRDLIDFPCADCWLDGYHLRGYTPRHSDNYRGPRPDYKYFQLRQKRVQGTEGGVDL